MANFFLFILLSGFLFVCNITLVAQTQSYSDIKFKLGQSYERSGDIESAVKLYKEAFSRDSSNIVIYDALKRLLIQLKQYSEAISLMEYRLKIYGKDIGTTAQLGSAYILASEEKKGIDVWDKTIEGAPNNENTYRIISSAATQNRLFDYAISVLKRGRSALSKPTLFTSDIARLYAAVLNYGAATREYLDMLQADPAQLGFVQMNIGTFTERPDGLRATTEAVEEALHSQSDNIQYHQLLAWLYMEGSQYDRAYDVYKFLDTKKSAKGTELFSFSERAARDKSFPVAQQALEEIIKLYPNSSIIPYVKFQLAVIFEESAEPVDTLHLFGGANPFSDTSSVQEKYRPALDIYNQIVANYTGNEIAARSYLRIAHIKKNKLFSPQDAMASLKIILKDYSNFVPITIEARMQIGDVFLLQNESDKAAEQFTMVINTKGVTPSAKDSALLQLAKIDYYNLKFQSALEKLSTLSSNSFSDEANDALLLKLFISENQTQSEDGLKEYARADFMRAQNKISESLALFKLVADKFPSSGIQEQSLMSIGDLQVRQHNFSESLTTYDTLAARFPESVLIDRILMKTGMVGEYGVKNKAIAIDAYQKLLSKLPNSIYANEARRRIRALRGDGI
jgi:tetratricopeptide (TPR) repeat protein